jgi:predicted Zn-dependent protease
MVPQHQKNDSSAMTRRRFLWLSSLSTAGVITGCAVNPVTGKRQLMLMSEAQEIQLDQMHSPHQFSADYGPSQDSGLNQYLNQLGKTMAALTHRPEMPYSFRAVNATYINAYAFPGGSIAATRGILLAMESEAELAALLGHELGHVNARHTAERMTKGMMLQALVGIGTIAVASANEKYAPYVQGLGSLGAGLLLAHYSREDERQADDLGMLYMTKSNYTPNGMVDLMDLLKSLSRHKPNAIEMMFSTHPMSDERYQTAVNSATTTYASSAEARISKERYMDNIAGLRRIKGAIEAMQEGDKHMAGEKYQTAESQYKRALSIAPRDYAGLVSMAKCQLALEKTREADRYIDRAVQAYPGEAQAHHIGGIANLMGKRYEKAFTRFDRYEQLLPGNPNTIFLKGYSQEGLQHRDLAANEYMRFLKQVNQGEEAQYAYDRLVEWGYVQPQQQQQPQQQKQQNKQQLNEEGEG